MSVLTSDELEGYHGDDESSLASGARARQCIAEGVAIVDGRCFIRKETDQRVAKTL